MKVTSFRSTLRIGAVAALVLLSFGSAAATSMQFLVTVDTAAVVGNLGFLDFQFNPIDSSSQIATAQVTNFNAGGGTLIFDANSPQVSGDVAGALPATVTLVNNSVPTANNDYFQQFTFGGFFSFVLRLTGPALDSPNGTATAGSRFGVGLYDQNQNSILTDQGAGTGFAGQVLVNLDGTTTLEAFPTATGGPSIVTFQALPEPGSMLLLSLGSLGLALLRRKRP